ncbi:TauD/TfdA family dioxygenase [Novosphingobium sp. G106]|uniref:TauD/TfdA dioxygenase family protein n=1 Tax=Novosphingobium sp. G106 TaxID=2849500 RepID=UPI001C2D4A66|nr:TauD/TfdA family dioxygenase [Novosphingobium sp. G106]MBV1687525.1 TauD/TfdA family dioxygenase [Novosphingobium sp. G106]
MATIAAPRASNRFGIAPITPQIGAQIEGIDIGGPLSDEDIAEIYQALLTYKVIFFRDQDISEEQHIAFALRFGELEIHPVTPADQPHREIFHLKTQLHRKTGADMWHSDVTWRERPSLGSILRGRIIPDVGGDTMFADMVAAYEGLSPAMKEWVCTLTAVHDGSVFATLQGKSKESFWEQFPLQRHPVVRTHPDTGQRALYVNCSFTTHIEGLSAKESDWLLNHLYDQASKPEYQVRFRWRPNSFAFWDNRACQHYAVADYWPAMRAMERVTVVGDKPFFDPARG